MSASVDYVSAVPARHLTLVGTETAGTETVGTETTGPANDVDAMYDEIERLDAEITAAALRRTELARQAGLALAKQGAVSGSREMATLKHFGDLGREGHTLGMMLLRMGRTAR